MTYTHKMTALPSAYDTAAIEKKWQAHWREQKTYAWNPATARADSYVIDTPPPTVSGTLHMGHVYSYTQADFIARFQRMNGKNVFYPMGFDDNGLPTERLVEKTKKIRASDMSREEFIQVCLGVSEEARKEFRGLFESIALSVDWDQEYHTISESSRRLSQLSFLDLVNKGHCYRALRPFYWDPVDQTAIAQAEIVDREIASFQNIILFEVDGVKLPVMTTRPELLPACVALMYHPDDAAKYAGKTARTPLFNINVPMIADEKVDPEKGTGLVMCCTFGDDTDKEWWEKHKLQTRVILNKYGKIDFSNLPEAAPYLQPVTPGSSRGLAEQHTDAASISEGRIPAQGRDDNPWMLLQGKKVSNPDLKNLGARETIIAALKEAGLLTEQKPITHAVKCAERSGAPLEILPTHQWFVKVTDKKEALLARTRECAWNPEWMRLRMEQWIEGLNQDWCISRQRYFGVPFPVWYVTRVTKNGQQVMPHTFTVYALPNQLPVNPLTTIPPGYFFVENAADYPEFNSTPDSASAQKLLRDENGDLFHYIPDTDVMDTWATSSISPQLSAHAIHGGYSPLEGESNPSSDLVGGNAAKDTPPGFAEGANPAHPQGVGTQAAMAEHHSPLTTHHSRFESLFPADLRPQAHEIIRTWAFYTLVKAHLHNDSVPWHNLMISGWCLAEDKSKMSKSKGNVVTPVALIEEKGTDAVRYWAGTSRLGQDTAFSPDLLKIGKKLVGKLWNATAFAAIHLDKLAVKPLSAKADMESGAICEVLDRWILSRLGQTIDEATGAFTRYEYADALDATNQFFWSDFCDNYLELIKKRVYNEDGSAAPAAQQSAVRTLYYVLEGILKLYAPFVPHVTEELYSHIFAEDYNAKGSLHGIGQWPLAAHYPRDAQALEAGTQALAVLELIRKAKSVGNVSIKFPVAMLTLSITDYPLAEQWLMDVMGAGNVRAHTLVKDAGFATEVTLAEAADAA